jgi:hypothetical protein
MTPDEHTHEDPAAGERVERPQALRPLDDVVAPDRLRFAVAEAVAEVEERRARRPPTFPRVHLRWGRIGRAVAVPLATTLVLAFLAQQVLTGGGSSATARDVAAVALRAPAAPSPAARPGGELLRAHAGPIAFPTWRRAGWHAVGARTDAVRGHEVRTVFYADGGGRRIGYAIADDALPASGGQVVMRRGAPLRVLDRGATSIVTWRRAGRTCVLAGRGVPVGRLLRLAGYAA